MTQSHNRSRVTTLAVQQTAQHDLHAKPNSASDGRELENDCLNKEQEAAAAEAAAAAAATTTTTTTTTNTEDA